MIKKYRILFFVIFTYILTFIGGTIFFNQQLNEVVPGWIMIILKIVFIPAVIAPFFIAMVMKYIENGKAGIKELLKLFFNKNLKIYWYLAAILIPFMVHFGASLIDILRGVPFQQPFGNANNNTIFVVLQIFLLAGVAEEMGWRGYLQPVLQQKYSAFTISIIIGIVVSVWHLPLFFQENDIHSGNAFWQFILLMIAVSFIYTWLMDNSKSVLILALFHTSHDITSLNFSQADYLSAFALYTIVAISIIVYYGPKFFGTKVNRDKLI